ncbi:RF-1 domain-containing protein [Cladorrhinum samala]|uniref:RF-1 domain-containing protein n=1 Tax=Cladorrhinum samala TaxID=585594 RepID=A0AAV9HJ12_9PEZI|nr:RF-1 domain-containing protein [Cladorrhinum samala]
MAMILPLRPPFSSLLRLRPFPLVTTSLQLARPLSKTQLPARPKPPPDSEIEESFLKGSGPGGQKINKTNSAVQLKHIPTGIVVKSQATRSRSQNRKIARDLLALKLDELQNGDQSRTAIVGDHKKKKAASKAKKSARKYKKLAEEKAAASAAAAGGLTSGEEGTQPQVLEVRQDIEEDDWDPEEQEEDEENHIPGDAKIPQRDNFRDGDV